MSVDKDTESPDRSVSSLSGRTGRQWTAFFQKIWKESGRGTRHRTVFLIRLEILIRTADRIETNRIRTGRHLTVNPDRIRTADRQTPDKNEIDNDVLTDNKLLILNVNRILRFVWTWTCHQESKIGPFEVISLPNPFSKSQIPNLPISITFNGF